MRTEERTRHGEGGISNLGSIAVSAERQRWKKERSRVKMGCEGMSSRCSSNATGQVTCTSKANWEQAKVGCPHPPVSSTVPKGYRKILVHFVKINSTNVIMNGTQHWRPQTSGVETHKEVNRRPKDYLGGWGGGTRQLQLQHRLPRGDAGPLWPDHVIFKQKP